MGRSGLSSDLVLVQNVSKLYRLYRRPSDRLRELLPGSAPVHHDFWALRDISFSVEKGETLGFMKVLVDAHSKEILGAAILGVGGDEVVQTLLDAMDGHLPYTTVQRGVRIHPTVSELLPTLLGELKPLG